MRAPATDPTELIKMRDSVYAIDLLITAIGKLNFFTWLSKNPGNINHICESLGLASRPVDVMLSLFKSYGLLTEKDKQFKLTLMAEEHLIDDSPFSLVPYYAIQTERPIVDKMLEVLKTGIPASWGGKMDEEEWIKAMERPEFAQKFTSGMNSRGAFLAPSVAGSFDFSKYSALLDIAGGSGIYTVAIKEKFPHLKAAIFERRPVDRIAFDSIKAFGMDGNISVIEGDMFNDELPKEYDVHLISHVLHDWNLEQNKTIVDNSYRNLKEGGIIIVLDAHLNKEKDGSIPVAEYSVLLMFATPGQCYGVGEMEDLLLNAGFKDIEHIPVVANRSLVIGKK